MQVPPLLCTSRGIVVSVFFKSTTNVCPYDDIPPILLHRCLTVRIKTVRPLFVISHGLNFPLPIAMMKSFNSKSEQA